MPVSNSLTGNYTPESGMINYKVISDEDSAAFTGKLTSTNLTGNRICVSKDSTTNVCPFDFSYSTGPDFHDIASKLSIDVVPQQSINTIASTQQQPVENPSGGDIVFPFLGAFEGTMSDRKGETDPFTLQITHRLSDASQNGGTNLDGILSMSNGTVRRPLIFTSGSKTSSQFRFMLQGGKGNIEFVGEASSNSLSGTCKLGDTKNPDDLLAFELHQKQSPNNPLIQSNNTTTTGAQTSNSNVDDLKDEGDLRAKLQAGDVVESNRVRLEAGNKILTMSLCGVKLFDSLESLLTNPVIQNATFHIDGECLPSLSALIEHQKHKPDLVEEKDHCSSSEVAYFYYEIPEQQKAMILDFPVTRISLRANYNMAEGKYVISRIIAKLKVPTYISDEKIKSLFYDSLRSSLGFDPNILNHYLAFYNTMPAITYTISGIMLDDPPLVGKIQDSNYNYLKELQNKIDSQIQVPGKIQ